MGEFAKLDPLLHSELRLAVMSTLLTMEEADFVYLREATGATAGNLSVQISIKVISALRIYRHVLPYILTYASTTLIILVLDKIALAPPRRDKEPLYHIAPVIVFYFDFLFS